MIEHLRRQGRLLLLAVGFLTRVPVPLLASVDNAELAASRRYHPLVGLGIGLVAALVYLLAGLCWPPLVALVLSMLATLLLTGALHEDGLADTCDGFGGGSSRQDKLRIMKDSRLGSYGAIGLVMALLLKLSLLQSLQNVMVGLLLAHVSSRALAVGLMWSLPYVRVGLGSKVQVMTGAGREADWLVLVITALAVALALLPPLSLLLILSGLALTGVLLRQWLLRQIGGCTGDTLGAAQQISELVVYVLLVALHA